MRTTTSWRGYLRRAGQDILAIGQYLEDEKNGPVRRDSCFRPMRPPSLLLLFMYTLHSPLFCLMLCTLLCFSQFSFLSRTFLFIATWTDDMRIPSCVCIVALRQRLEARNTIPI